MHIIDQILVRHVGNLTTVQNFVVGKILLLIKLTVKTFIMLLKISISNKYFLFIFTFYSSRNPEKIIRFSTKNIQQHSCFQH